MKRILAVTVICAVLVGCGGYPQSAQEARDHMMFAENTVTVNRSATATMNTIANRARACMNSTSQDAMMQNGVTAAIITNSYRTRRDGRTLVMEHNNPDNVGNPGWYTYLVVDVTSTSSGAQVTTYAAPTNGVFTNAIAAWARGDTSPCPRSEFS